MDSIAKDAKKQSFQIEESENSSNVKQKSSLSKAVDEGNIFAYYLKYLYLTILVW